MTRRRTTGSLGAAAVAVSCLLAPALALAGGWPQERTAGYVKLWTRTLVASAGITANDTLVDTGGTFVDTSLNFYGEYGLTDRLTLISFGAPVGWAGFEGSNQVYVGPLAVGARYGMPVGPVHLAVEAHYVYAPPIGDGVLFEGVSNGERWVYRPTVSDHRGDAELQLGIGLPFGWATLSGGLHVYGRPRFDPALYGMAQLGVESSFGLVGDIHTNIHQPLGDIDKSNIAGTGETQYIGFGISLSYWFSDHWSVVIAAEGAANFVNNANTPSLILGLENRAPPTDRKVTSLSSLSESSAGW